jgi:hypothetical protein
MDTYGEYSPSWNKETGEGGVHLLYEGKPVKNIKVGTVEIYGENHYLTITTHQLPDTPTTINQRQEALEALFPRIANDRSPTLGNIRGWQCRFGQPTNRSPNHHSRKNRITRLFTTPSRKREVTLRGIGTVIQRF